MSRIIDKIVERIAEDKIIVRGIGRPKQLTLPPEVIDWLINSKAAIRILDELIGHHKFRHRLSHPGAIRSLILLLYARSRGSPPYKVAQAYGVAPEQLYRLERGLKSDGLYEFVINLLSLDASETDKTPSPR